MAWAEKEKGTRENIVEETLMLVDKTSFALGLPPKYKSTPNWETISS